MITDISIRKRVGKGSGNTAGLNNNFVKERRSGRRSRTDKQRQSMEASGLSLSAATDTTSFRMKRMRLRRAGAVMVRDQDEARTLIDDYLKNNKVTQCPPGEAWFGVRHALAQLEKAVDARPRRAR